MKGFYIFEEEFSKGVVDCLEIGEISHEFKSLYDTRGEISTEVNMHAMMSKTTKTKCSKDDTYDFETGALIALMKMCGLEKSAKAYAEIFDDTAYGDALIERDRLERLLRSAKEAINVKAGFIKEKNEEIEKLKKEIKRLKKDNEELKEKNEKLQHEYNLCKNSENALKCSVEYLNKTVDKLSHSIDGYKNDLYKTAKRCRELEAKEAILNKQEETINKKEEEMSVYFGGRGNGKQYKALVELFKKTDQKKVDAAYKEAYGNRVIWCSSQSSTRDMLDSLLDSCKYAILTDKDGGQIEKWTGISEFTWVLKVPTRREQMWDRIIKSHKANDVIIEVKKEDVSTFLHEIENKFPEITWSSGDKIFKTKYTIKDIYRELETHNRMYFRLSKNTNLSYSSDLNVYLFKNLDVFSYLPPMRWDLFKKGRKIVRVTPENIDDFIVKCINKFGGIMKPVLKRYKDFTHSFIMISDYYYDNKPAIHIMTPEDLVRNQHENPKKYSDKKIVDWEDVR